MHFFSADGEECNSACTRAWDLAYSHRRRKFALFAFCNFAYVLRYEDIIASAHEFRNRGPEVRNFVCDVCVFPVICRGMDGTF